MWADAVDENEMDEECLKSSNEQYALWTTDVLLHSSSTGTYSTVQYSTVPHPLFDEIKLECYLIVS